MKIFSSFDTNLAKKRFVDAVKKYGKDDVLLVRRSPIYLWLRVYNISLIWLFSSVLWLWWIYSTKIWRLITIWRIAVIVSGMYVAWRAIGKLIDYHMDFTLITPKQITSYDQWGLLDRSIRALDIMKVKSINIEQNGLLRSIFNYGSIIFFSEGDVSWGDNPLGDIELHHISHPARLKDKIAVIIDKYQTMHRRWADITYIWDGWLEKKKEHVEKSLVWTS